MRQESLTETENTNPLVSIIFDIHWEAMGYQLMSWRGFKSGVASDPALDRIKSR